MPSAAAEPTTGSAVGLRAVGALVLFCALTVAHTWPLATAPGAIGRNDNKDTMLNTWAIAWVAHALVTSPSQVLAGNIFHPERHTLAFSDPVIVPGLLSVPVRAAGASPVLTYNISLLVGYALSGWAMWWLAWRWTQHHGGALVAGSLFAFNAHTLVSMGHIQAIHAYGLPLLMVGLDGLVDPRQRGVRFGMLTGLATVVLALTSGYLAIFGVVCGLVMTAVRWRALLAPPRRPLLTGALAAALVIAVPVLPVMRAYADVQRTHGFTRSLDLVASLSANGAAYLATPARIHQGWSRPVYQTWEPRDSLFPGMVASVLAALGVGLWRGRWRDPRLLFALALTFVGLTLSFGPATPLYTLFYSAVPFASSVRAASRFGVLYLSGLAILAAFGVAALGLRWPRAAVASSVLALVAVNAEAFRGPVPYVPAVPAPAIYDTLAGLGEGVVVEMPFWWRPVDVPRNANYMLASTSHWKPLLNGYSGFTPASYRRRADILWYFPFRAASFDELDRAGVRYLVMHLVEYGSQRQEALDLIAQSGRWRRVEQASDTVLFERIR